MTLDQTTKQALAIENLSLPASPRIATIHAHTYEDSSGEESLEIWVILSDSTSDDDLTGENVMQIKSAIRESLINSGIQHFPYVRMIRQKDYQAEAASE